MCWDALLQEEGPGGSQHQDKQRPAEAPPAGGTAPGSSERRVAGDIGRLKKSIGELRAARDVLGNVGLGLEQSEAVLTRWHREHQEEMAAMQSQLSQQHEQALRDRDREHGDLIAAMRTQLSQQHQQAMHDHDSRHDAVTGGLREHLMLNRQAMRMAASKARQDKAKLQRQLNNSRTSAAEVERALAAAMAERAQSQAAADAPALPTVFAGAVAITCLQVLAFAKTLD